MTRRLTGFIFVTLATVLIVGSLPAAGVGAVETSEGYRVILGDENATFEALDETPMVNGRPAPDETTPVEESAVEPWRGYERTWLANVTGSGSVLVMGARTGVVLEAEGSQGDGGSVVEEEGEGGEEREDEMQEPPREENDPDAEPSPEEDMGLASAGREGNVEVGSGEEEGDKGVGSRGEAGGSWWLVGALFAVAGGLGVLEVIQRVRRGRAVLVVPGLEGTREVVLVEAGTGVGKDA